MVTRKKQAGLTVIEMSIVLLIMGILVYLALDFFLPKWNETKRLGETQAVQEIIGNVHQDFRGSSDYSSLSVANMIKRHRIPEKMVASPTTLKNAWGGDVTLTGAVGTITLTENNIPASQCMNMAYDLNSLFRNITVGGTAVKTNGSQINQSALDTACGAADELTLVFIGS